MWYWLKIVGGIVVVLLAIREIIKNPFPQDPWGKH